MSTPSSSSPKIVSHNIPQIEIYQVSDDELSRIEEVATKVGNEFAFMLTGVSISVTLLIALTQGEFQKDVEIIMKASLGISVLISIYMGIKWFRSESSVSKILSRIRSRRTEPDT